MDIHGSTSIEESIQYEQQKKKNQLNNRDENEIKRNSEWTYNAANRRKLRTKNKTWAATSIWKQEAMKERKENE